MWISLAVQWLRLCASNAGALGLIPGQGTTCHGMAKKKNLPMDSHNTQNKNQYSYNCL